jgi:uracil-DNA glycosylase
MLTNIDLSWKEIVENALFSLDREYQLFLENDKNYFPDRQNFLNAFKTLPLHKTKYILFGQDPYPRKESAGGYAFIDMKVKTLFDKNGGFSKEVNKATSLRNMMKMFLLCDEKLKDDFSKDAVKKVNTKNYINSIEELKQNFEKNGVLLLNTALIFTSKEDTKLHAKMWKPFIETLLKQLSNHDIKLILFGNISKEIAKFESAKNFETIKLPHPYNIGFITKKEVHEIFCKMELLKKY